MFSRRLKQKKGKYIQYYIVFYLLLLGNTWECQAAERYQFDLPAMNAAAALDKLADISGYSLIYPFGDAIAIVTNPLFGTYSLSEALDMLLLNTPLSAIATEKRVIAVSSILSNDNNDFEHFEIKVHIKNQLKQQMDNILNGAVNVVATFPSTDFSYSTENDEKNRIKRLKQSVF